MICLLEVAVTRQLDFSAFGTDVEFVFWMRSHYLIIEKQEGK